ncbi:MAG: NAD-dependent epimerase/dehydratase family protein [Proteobacteria bacterium]|nr:NAD-dependent epimerase/dehydratase family protein [Pseudomonadota bacterium]MBU4296678.1 NAD-dependent epimerase/dehydratase family protein [Pseudomonadota bacterium]MCG2748471.1 NAD-dependent epimerase/dehydratase family protein [Desulfobulbaceae bacterium]
MSISVCVDGFEMAGEMVCIFGATGFIGSNLVRFLVRHGYRVRVYCRKTSNLENLAANECEIFYGTLDDEKSLRHALEGSAIAYNLAVCGENSQSYYDERVQVNVAFPERLARVALQVGLRLVHVSSTAAVGTPGLGVIADESFQFNNQHDHYAVTKAMGEQKILHEVGQGLDAVIAIPANVVGAHAMKSGQRLNFEKIAKGKMKVYPAGGVCLVSVEDVVQGLHLCAQKGETGQRYILGGNNVSFLQYFQAIACETAGKAPFVPIPGPLLKSAGYLIENFSRILGKEPFITEETCRMVSSFLYFSSQKAREKLGYVITPLDKTIKNAVHPTGREI